MRTVPALLTLREVAAALRVSSATVYGLCERGELAHFRVANSIRVPREAVEALTAGALARTRAIFAKSAERRR